MKIETLKRKEYTGGYSYDALIDSISHCFSRNVDNAEAGIAAVSDELKAFGKENLRSFLEQAVEQPEWLEKIAARSYLHGNGFYKIILEENDAFRLRLHIWLPTSRAEENIHDHRWHFASVILNGSMETEIWEDALPGGGEALDEYLYIGKTKDTEARNLYMGKARVSLKNRIFNGAGDSYYMMSNVMHRIIYDGKETISTLMCHAKDARNWARTITRREDEPNVDHGYITPDALKSVLSSYLETL
jgi:hypothetical protein